MTQRSNAELPTIKRNDCKSNSNGGTIRMVANLAAVAINRVMRPNGRVKAGNGQAAAAARRALFVQAYIANGNNATQAAITAGYSARTAYSQGQRMLKHVEISGQLANAAKKVGEIAGLTAERTLRETARISYADPRRLYHADGTLKQIAEMDEDTRAAIASFEIEENKVDGEVVGRTIKVKLWDKNRALEMSMRHLGMYERDNARQGRESLVLRVEAAKPVKRDGLESL